MLKKLFIQKIKYNYILLNYLFTKIYNDLLSRIRHLFDTLWIKSRWFYCKKNIPIKAWILFSLENFFPPQKILKRWKKVIISWCKIKWICWVVENRSREFQLFSFVLLAVCCIALSWRSTFYAHVAVDGWCHHAYSSYYISFMELSVWGRLCRYPPCQSAALWFIYCRIFVYSKCILKCRIIWTI